MAYGELPGVYHCRWPRSNLQMSYLSPEELVDAQFDAELTVGSIGILDELRGTTDEELEAVVREVGVAQRV